MTDRIPKIEGLEGIGQHVPNRRLNFGGCVEPHGHADHRKPGYDNNDGNRWAPQGDIWHVRKGSRSHADRRYGAMVPRATVGLHLRTITVEVQRLDCESVL